MDTSTFRGGHAAVRGVKTIANLDGRVLVPRADGQSRRPQTIMVSILKIDVILAISPVNFLSRAIGDSRD
jgi:hypothetical protein